MAKEELSRECNYELEAKNQKRFRELLSNTEGFYVPMVVDDILSKRVLTTELVSGDCVSVFLSIFCYHVDCVAWPLCLSYNVQAGSWHCIQIQDYCA